MVCLPHSLEIHWPFQGFFPFNNISVLCKKKKKSVVAQTLPYAEGDSFCLWQPEELGHSNHPGASA